MSTFDLLVIGGGSGGLAAAQKAATFGAKVALIEKSKLGGTCVNAGCVPKKIMWYAAQLAENFRVISDYGFTVPSTSFDFSYLVKHREQYLRKLNQLYADRLTNNAITYLQGNATFADAHTIAVCDQTYTASHILIATGAYPYRPNIVGANLAIDSDGFFALQTQPKRVAIIGSGYIAVEIAGLLNQLGTEVNLLVRHDKILSHFDGMLSESLMEIMVSQGINVLTFHDPQEITKHTDKFTVHCKQNKSVTHLDQVLFATGRRANIQDLNLEKINIDTNKHGFIQTDKFENTNVPHIYAVGDVTGKKLLTPVAIAAGRRLASRLFGADEHAHLDYDYIPSVVFSDPPIGSVGLSEEEAVKNYGREQIKVYQTKFNSLFYALSKHKVPTRMKLITLQSTDKIIGCHIIGMGADEMLQGFAVAIKMGATKKDLDQTVGIHPTSAEELVTLT